MDANSLPISVCFPEVKNIDSSRMTTLEVSPNSSTSKIMVRDKAQGNDYITAKEIDEEDTINREDRNCGMVDDSTIKERWDSISDNPPMLRNHTIDDIEKKSEFSEEEQIKKLKDEKRIQKETITPKEDPLIDYNSD